MLMSPFEDRMYAVFFYILAAAVVIGVGGWIYWLSKKAKNKGR
jgi:hypothetical protein